MNWNRSLSDSGGPKRRGRTLEQVMIVATLLVAATFEVWFIMFAHQTPWAG